MRTQSKNIKLLKARENARHQVVIGSSLYLIGWEKGTSFLGQSQSEVKHNQSNHELLSTLTWKLLKLN